MANSVFDKFRGLDPSVQAALIQLAGGAIGGIGDQIESNRERKDSKNLSRAELIDRALSEEAQEDFARAQAGLNATQMDPYAQAKDLFRAQAMAQLFGNAQNEGFTFNPKTGMGEFTGGISIPKEGLDVSALSPEALAQGASYFYRNAAQVQPRVGAPDLSQVGLGEAGAGVQGDIDAAQARSLNDLTSARQRRMDLINKALEEEKKKGGGFWSKLGKIGLIAGGGIATALTGGAAAPLLGAAIGAGEGALSGGGLKGALLGAATGGLTGGLGGGAASGIKQGLGSAIKSTLSSPSTLARIGGAAVGGPAETISNYLAGYLPKRKPMAPPSTSTRNYSSKPYSNVRFNG